jgi:hypothetical protein
MNMFDTVALACADCGIEFGVSKSWCDARMRDHKTFYCPDGHKQHFPGKTEAERLAEALEIERRRGDAARAQVQRTRLQLRAQKGVATRLRKRLTDA